MGCKKIYGDVGKKLSLCHLFYNLRYFILAVSSYTPTFFILHPHNFVNFEIDLHMLLNSGSGSALWIHQSRSESCCFPDEWGVPEAKFA